MTSESIPRLNNLHLSRADILGAIYCKIPNISLELIEVRKHFFLGRGAYIRGEAIFGGDEGHFVLVSEYQDFEIHCYVSVL